MTAELAAELRSRRLVPLPDAARMLNIKSGDLRQMMAARGLPVIELSERRRSIRLQDLDQLIAGSAKPAAQETA